MFCFGDRKSGFAVVKSERVVNTGKTAFFLYKPDELII